MDEFEQLMKEHRQKHLYKVIDSIRNYPYRFSKDELLQILIKLTCSLPCVGYVNETGWHKGCIKRAEEALEVIWIYK